MPRKIIKKNSDIFSDIRCKVFNKSLETCKFSSSLKMANVTSIDLTKTPIVQSVFYQICQKFLEGVYVNKFLHFLRISFLSINAGLRKNIVLNTACKH